MRNVAFILFNVSEALAGGGAERQFSDTYDFYQNRHNNLVNLFFIIDNLSYKNLMSIEKLKNQNNLIVVPSFEKYPKYLKILLWNLILLYKIFKFKIDLLHIPMPDVTYIPTLLVLNKISKRKLVFNATDCTIAYHFDSLPMKNPYKFYINYIKFDAVYSWYRKFADIFSKVGKLCDNDTPIVCAKYCFANLDLYKTSSKKKIIIWAARLVDGKQPAMFLEAVKIFKEKYIEDSLDWKFFIYGDGPLKKELENKIFKYDLSDIIEIKYSHKMHEVFPSSKLFISTQDFENFTSLSMIEAMASGNAIIARNVGQTNYFVKDGQNGFLLTEDSPANLAYMIYQYIQHPEIHSQMEKTSISIATHIHTIENFVNDLENFWVQTLKGQIKCAV